jgi:cobyric acid synthase
LTVETHNRILEVVNGRNAVRISEAQLNQVVYRLDAQGNRVYGTVDRVFQDRVMFLPKPVRQDDGTMAQAKPTLIAVGLHGILPNLHVYSAFADEMRKTDIEMQAWRRKREREVNARMGRFNAQVQAALSAHRIKQGWVKAEEAKAEPQEHVETPTTGAWA